MISYMWGKRWRLPREKTRNEAAELPPRITTSEFWKGSAIGVAVGARSFPGIIAIHANADYILNFEKEIGVQRQIQELGRQSDTEFVAFSTATSMSSPIPTRAVSDSRKRNPWF